MIWITHIAFTLLIGMVLKVLGIYDNFLFLIFLSVGAVFPDLDTPYSFASRLFLGKTRRVINPGYHRGFLHSIYAAALIFVVLSVFTFLYSPWFEQESFAYAIIPFTVGYISHLVLDMLNPSGIRPFYKHGPRIRWKIRTGSIQELMLLLIVSAIVLTLLAFDIGTLNLRTVDGYMIYLALGELFVAGMFGASTAGMRTRRKKKRESAYK